MNLVIGYSSGNHAMLNLKHRNRNWKESFISTKFLYSASITTFDLFSDYQNLAIFLWSYNDWNLQCLFVLILSSEGQWNTVGIYHRLSDKKLIKFIIIKSMVFIHSYTGLNHTKKRQDNQHTCLSKWSAILCKYSFVDIFYAMLRQRLLNIYFCSNIVHVLI